MNFKLTLAAAAALTLATPAMAGWAGATAGKDAKGNVFLFSVQTFGRGGAAPGATALCKERGMRQCAKTSFGIYDECAILVGGILPNGNVEAFAAPTEAQARAACAQAGAKCSPKVLKACAPDDDANDDDLKEEVK